MVDEKTRIMVHTPEDVVEEAGPLAILEPGVLKGSRLDRYKVGDLIGTGGGSHVYKAYDTTLEREVALKILFGHERDWTRQALTEARAQAQVDHEYICKVYDVGNWEGHAFIAMQYLDGQPLDAATQGQSPREKAELFRRILLAVDAAHRRGLIHRDLKPGNILVVRSAGGFYKPYVTDFGLARNIHQTQRASFSGKVQGTPNYMAPEQARGESIRDTHSDIYSLGATFYKVLAGEAPFQGNNAVSVILKVVRETPKPIGDINSKVPPELAAIVMRAMAKSPEDRFDAAEFARELTRFLEGRPVDSYKGGLSYRFRSLVNRHRGVSALVALLLLSITVFGALGARQRWENQQQSLYLERFMDGVKAIQWQMRVEHMLPAHNVEPERARVRERMAAIEIEMNRLGPLARGPGLYALAKGYLTLDNPDRALEYLEKARDLTPWRDQVDHAWGEATVRVYHHRLRDVERMRDNDSRIEEVSRLKRNLLEPALAAIRGGRDDALKPGSFIEAQIAYFEGRDQAALKLARDAAKSNTWLYETLLLEAEIHIKMGRDHLQAKQLGEARLAFDTAGAVLARARTIAASDIELYLIDCERLTWTLDIDLIEGGDFEKTAETLMDLTHQSLIIEPGNSVVFAYRGYTYYREAEKRFYYEGKNPEPALVPAVEAFREAIARNPQHAWAYLYLGHVYGLRADYEREQKKENGSLLEQARLVYSQALDISPVNVEINNSLGVTAWQMAEQAIAQGEDPGAYLDAARNHFNDVLGRMPSFELAYNNLGLVHWSAAEWAIKQGTDPVGSFEAGARAFEKAIELGGLDYAYGNLAELNLTRIALALKKGEDPSDLLAASERACLAMLAVNDNYLLPYTLLAATRRLAARAAVVFGKDPEPSFAAALEALKSAPNTENREMLDLEYSRLLAERLLLTGETLPRADADGLLRRARTHLAALTDEDAPEYQLLRAVFDLIALRIAAAPSLETQQRVAALLAAEPLLVVTCQPGLGLLE